MDFRSALHGAASVLNIFHISYIEFVFVCVSFFLICGIVGICSRREQYTDKNTPKRLPFDHTLLGRIWSRLSLTILVFRLVYEFFAERIAVYIPVEDIRIWWETHRFINAVVGAFFPVPTPVTNTFQTRPKLLGMLLIYFFLEFLAHEELRVKVGKKLPVPGWYRRWKEKYAEEEDTDDFRLYNQKPSQQRVFLQEEYIWLRAFYPVAILLVLLLNVRSESTSELMLFPLVVLTEFWIQVAFHTEREFYEIEQQQDRAAEQQERAVERQDSFHAVLDELEKMEKELSFRKFTAFSSSPAPKVGKRTDIREKRTQEERLIECYLDICEKAGETVSPELELPARAMLNGESIVFSTRFYQDIDYAFYLPMLRTLQRGYHCLVISGDQIATQPLADWLTEGRRHILGDPALWKMNRLEAGARQAQTDIGYMTASDLGNSRLMEENSAFLGEVKLVLIINASSLLHKQLFGTMRLRKKLHRDCTFAICNDNAEGLTDIYSHLLQTNLRLVYPTTRTAERGAWIFFDAEEAVGGASACRQYQLGCRILSTKSKAIEEVRWYSRSVSPVKDFMDLFGMLHSADEYDLPKQRQGKIILGTEDTNYSRRDFSCVMVEDEIHNPAELSVQFASRGRKGVIAAIFSPYYFFRDYIRENVDTFQKNVRKIAQTFPAYCMTERNAVLQMLWNMEQERLDEDDIHAICVLLGQITLEMELLLEGHVDPQKLEEKFRTYTGIQNVGYYLHCEHKYHRGRVVREFWLDPLLETEKEPGYDVKRPCCYICAAFGPDRRPLDQYSKVQLAQCYLPGQIVSLAGHSYEVMSIVRNGNAVEMYVRRSVQSGRLRTSYLQKRTVSISEISGAADLAGIRSFPLRDGGQILLRRCEAETMQVVTEGYWTLSGEKGEEPYTPLASKQKDDYVHVLQKKEYLRVEISSPAWKAAFYTLMFDFSEMFRTVYAEYMPQLLVCKPISGQAGDRIVMENLGRSEYPNDPESMLPQAFYIIEDSEEDLGLLDSIVLHFERLLGIISDAETWMKEISHE